MKWLPTNSKLFGLGVLAYVGLGLCVAVDAATLDAYLHNRQGVKDLQEKKNYPAFKEFSKALESDPLNLDVQMNLGLAFEANQEWEKAEAVYKGVLKSLPPDSPRRFEVLFNMAGVQGQQKKIDDALANYQAALQIVPDSREVKTNIELLFLGGGEGGGEGEQKDSQDQEGKGQPKEGDEKDKKDNSQGQKQQEQKKNQPKPFKSEQLTPMDVKKILDEIKNQEQGIRAQEYDKSIKETPRGKDW